MNRASHGDGRYMTIAEAIERRTTALTRGLGLSFDFWPPHRSQDRRWLSAFCQTCAGHARLADDVGVRDGIPVAMCRTCRGLDG